VARQKGIDLESYRRDMEKYRRGILDTIFELLFGGRKFRSF